MTVTFEEFSPTHDFFDYRPPAHPLLLETPALRDRGPGDSVETIVADCSRSLTSQRAAGCYLDVNH